MIMPQTSPMNWIFISLMNFLSILKINKSLSFFLKNNTSSLKMIQLNMKPIKW